jgi:proteasome lid subunit RPN8/RPN11
MFPRSIVLTRFAVWAASKSMMLESTRESCGLLIGGRKNSHVRVTKIIMCTNLAFGPDQFVLSPRQYGRIVKDLRKSERIIGVVHSHAGCESPSPVDARGIKLHDFVWLIVGNTRSLDIGKLKYAAYGSGPRRGVRRLAIRWE